MSERYTKTMKQIPIDIDNIDFEALENEAVDHIPKQYKDKMQNVAFKVEEEPSIEQRMKLQLRNGQSLYGLYEGVPLPQRNGAVLSKAPDVITIFKHPMVDIHRNLTTLKEQVYETVWHEVAHYFGLNHRDIHAAKNNQP